MKAKQRKYDKTKQNKVGKHRENSGGKEWGSPFSEFLLDGRNSETNLMEK